MVAETKTETFKDGFQKYLDNMPGNGDTDFLKATIDFYDIKKEIGTICDKHPESLFIGYKDKVICQECLIVDKAWAIVNLSTYLSIAFDTIVKGMSNMSKAWQNLSEDQKDELMVLVQKRRNINGS